MPTFDIPGRVKGQPYTVTLTGREGQRLSFGRWPYTTEDPAKIEALDGYCFVQRVPEPEPAPQPAPQPEARCGIDRNELIDSLNSVFRDLGVQVVAR